MAIHRADGHTTDLPNLQSVVTNRSCDQFIMADREGGIWFYSFETDVPVRVCDGEDLVMLTSDELLYDTTFAVGNSVSVYGNRRLMTDTLDHLFFAAERAEGEADLYYIDSFSGASVRSVDRIDLRNGEGYFVRNMGIQREGGCILRVDEEKSRIVYVSQDTVRLADLTSGYIKELSPLSGASSFLIDKKMKNIMIRRGNDEVECIRMSDLESKTKKIKNAISDSFFMVSTDSFEGGGYFTKDALVLIDFKGKKRTISCSMELAETLSGEMPVVIRNMTYWTMSGSESYKDGKNCVLIGDSKLAVWPSDGTNEGAERSDQKEHFLLKLLRAILEA